MKHGTTCLVWLHDRAPIVGLYLAPTFVSGTRAAVVSIEGEQYQFAAEIVSDAGDLADAIERGSLPSSQVGRA